jgi:hypothetical protein
MSREVKISTIIILIGICIPLAVLPFTSGYSKEKNAFQNLYEVGIALGHEKQPDAVKAESPVAPGKEPRRGPDFRALIPRKIPFRFILAVAVVFVFVGFVRLDRARRRGKEEPEAEPLQEDRQDEERTHS